MPRYEVIDELPGLTFLEEYQDHILNKLDKTYDDIITRIIREVTFNDDGYIESKICVVRQVETYHSQHRSFLEGKGIYCVVESLNNDNETMSSMFDLIGNWASENHIYTRGVVYINIRIVMIGSTPRTYHECWVPIESN